MSHDPDYWKFSNQDGKLERCDMRQFKADLDAAIRYQKECGVMNWQSEEMKSALANDDPVLRLLDVIELLHPLPLSDPKHGFVDMRQLIIDAYAIYNPMKEGV